MQPWPWLQGSQNFTGLSKAGMEYKQINVDKSKR